ncbi:MAG: D-alanyl-D-alanine carboxypeptidase [Bacteroidota bacterium]
MRLLLTIALIFSFSIYSNAQANHNNEESLVKTSKFNVKKEKKLYKQLDNLPVFENSFSGLCVYDVEKGEYVVQYNSDRYFTPASNTKIFSFYSGITNIGDRIPTLYYTEKEDSLIIWGSGAPTLLYSEFDDDAAFKFLKNTKKQIYFSDANFSKEHFGAGWAWDDYNENYSKDISPLAVYGNAVNVTLYPNGTWEVNPKQFRDSIKVYSNAKKFKLRRDERTNNFEMWLPATNSKDTLHKEVPFITSTQLNLKLLSDSINKEIIYLDRKIHKDDINQSIYGIASDSIYKVMMQDSDNFLAESVLLMSAMNIKQTDSLNRSCQIDYLLKNDLADLTHKPRWVDGSGLSRYNLFTPKSMVEILIKIREEAMSKDHNMDKIFEFFPTGGKTGTLDGRFKDLPPFIHAKTGTVSNNHNLSGYLITKSGKLLIFSYMNNHYKYKTSTIKKQTDTILEDFYKYY